jgi:hypothetical protein
MVAENQGMNSANAEGHAPAIVSFDIIGHNCLKEGYSSIC